MKALNVLFAAMTLTLAAGVAQADVRPDKIPDVLQSKQIQPFDQLNQIAIQQHPGATITDTELDKKLGKLVYEVELRDSKNIEWDVKIDAATGEVLENKQDT